MIKNWFNLMVGRKKPAKYSEGLAYTLLSGGTAYAVSGIGTCTDLDINIPPEYNGLPVTQIADYAFNGTNIESVTIPETIAVFGYASFLNLSRLATLTLKNGDTLISVAANCFRDTNALKTLYYHGDINHLVGGIANVGQLCKNLTSLYINNVKPVDIDISNATKIDNYVFINSSNIENVLLNNNIISIGNSSFRSCGNLKRLNSNTDGTIILPINLASIGEYAFRGCTNINKIVLGENVTNIGYAAFAEISMYPELIIKAINPPTIGNMLFYNVQPQIIYVPAESVEAYKTASGWSNYASIIQAIPA